MAFGVDREAAAPSGTISETVAGGPEHTIDHREGQAHDPGVRAV